LNPHRCGVFFAQRALLVEGPSENAFINYLVQTARVAPPEGGVFVLDCLGKFNIHRFMNLLRELRIEHSVLHDSDEDRGKAEDKEMHRRVNRLIERSKNDLTALVHVFNADLETFLGCPIPDKEHRKPARLLLALQEQQIADSRVSEFCDLVARLLNTPIGGVLASSGANEEPQPTGQGISAPGETGAPSGVTGE
jgi:hypothetical protein